MVSQRVKEQAYKIDPECWVSYSGQPKDIKQYMEIRRQASLEKARIALGEPEPDTAESLLKEILQYFDDNYEVGHLESLRSLPEGAEIDELLKRARELVG